MHSILLDVDVIYKSAWSVHRRVQEICRTELSLLYNETNIEFSVKWRGSLYMINLD